MDLTPALSGRTLLTAIFGDPVEHSLSPAMHNAAYAALKMERAYVAFHVTPERLRNALRAVSALGILGVNLTVPHKERAFRMMAHLSDEARRLGAVNCIVNREGVLYGDNTDARGLEIDLRDLGIALEGRTASRGRCRRRGGLGDSRRHPPGRASNRPLQSYAGAGQAPRPPIHPPNRHKSGSTRDAGYRSARPRGLNRSVDYGQCDPRDQRNADGTQDRRVRQPGVRGYAAGLRFL